MQDNYNSLSATSQNKDAIQKEIYSVLVVDDNPLITQILKKILEKNDLDVIIAENGVAALKAVDERHFDLIVCDVMMPEIDGYQLKNLLQSRGEYSQIPFIFLSALSEKEEQNKGYESGADGYMVKPFDPEELLAQVKGRIKRSKERVCQVEGNLENFRKKVVQTLSHEFRTPLVAIRTGAELLIDQVENLSQEKVVTLLQSIQRGGLRLERLVGDFMLLQQIEAGVAAKVFVTHARVEELDQVIKDLLEEGKERYSNSKLKINYINNNKKTSAKIYKPHLVESINRVIDNTIKFAVKDKPPILDLSVEISQGWVEIRLRDYGIGLDQKMAEKAKELFIQINRDKLEQQGGGIGLGIATKLMEIQGGKLQIKQAEGDGVEVKIILPAGNL
jgi:DNA-binding response OmpR family regulator